MRGADGADRAGQRARRRCAARCRAGVRVVTAGAPPAAATIERLEGEFGWEVTQVYGLTETAPFITVCAPLPEHEELSPADRAVLKARQGVELLTSGELRVVDDDGREVPADGQTLGEIVVRGNVVMDGYYNDPEATEHAMGDGWFHTGDAAVVHPDGYVEIRDRLKDVIISGGENISSVEVEGVLLRHPAVQEVAIVGLPHEKWGETPHAFVVLRDGQQRDRGGDHRVRARAAGALQGPARGHLRRPSCRRPRPARSRSTCCARARRTSPSSRPWSGRATSRRLRRGSCTRTARSCRTTGSPRTPLPPCYRRRARGWRRPCR